MTAGVTKPVAATGEDGRHLYTCPLGEAMCGLEIEVSDGKVAGIRGNRDDTWSRGHICLRGRRSARCTRILIGSAGR
ncbi:MAG: hypothetical protein QOJ24_1680 [Mycobacterium sp.]|jgi:anaerobic selenocysteine-containing dehydrogenase|nr:hypothetical protein [Mycobacterium sp.]